MPEDEPILANPSLAAEKELTTCENGHEYNPQAGACPFCTDTPPASAKDSKGEERFQG